MVCCMLTFVLFILILAFQIEYVSEQRGTTLYRIEEEYEFDTDYEFKTEDGFNFAVGLIDPDQPAFIDDRAVTLQIYYMSWSSDQTNGARTATYTTINSHQCTSEELGYLNNGREEFYTHTKSRAAEIARFQSHF